MENTIKWDEETLNDFNIYKKVSKKEIKFYIIFSKYF